MADVPDISDAEWAVMKGVWDRGPATSGEIARAVGAETGWRPRTVKTLLGRLVKKGAVGSSEADGKVLYKARVTREACVRRESRSFLRRVFDGAVTPALVHFIEDAKLSEAEVEELRRVLRREGGK